MKSLTKSTKELPPYVQFSHDEGMTWEFVDWIQTDECRNYFERRIRGNRTRCYKWRYRIVESGGIIYDGDYACSSR